MGAVHFSIDPKLVSILQQQLPLTIFVETGTFKGESDAPFKGQGLEGGGTYIAHLTFDKAGDWGVEVTASRPNGSHTTVRLPMNVIALPVVPGVGQPAPATHNPTVKDVADVETID